MTDAAITLKAPAAPVDLSAAAYGKTPKLGAKTEAEAAKVGQDFEAMFLSQMLTPIFDQLETDGPFGGGSAERMFRSFQVEQYGKAIAKAGGIGLAGSIQREILMLQEKANGAASPAR